jgi:RNA polymerase sigma factor (sigma-70 family)
MTTAELVTRSGEGDAEAVERARMGDREAWRKIVRRFDAALWTIARAHGLDHQSCGDVVQQTWLAAVSQLEALRSAEAFRGWLYTIARRECRKAVARRKRETVRLRAVHSVADSESQEPQLGSGLRTPEDEVLLTEQRTLLQAAWGQLSQRDQDLLTLLMDERRPAYSEISRHTGLPIGSIGPTRARCLARLRVQLEALGVDHRWSAA